MQAAAAAKPADPLLGALPQWDLGHLYAGPQDPALAADLARARERAAAFRAAHEGKVAALDGPGLAAAIAEYEAIDELLGRVGSYAQLLHAGDMADPAIGRFYQSITEALTDIGSLTLFFTLALNRLEDAALTDPALDRWRPWLARVRAYRPHQLADELERLLHEKQVAGRAAWVRLYDETLADLRFAVREERLTLAEVLNRLTDRDGAEREAAARAIAHSLGEKARLFALITNTLAKDKAIEDQWRGYPRPISARNIGNQVEDAVVDALIAAVREAYPRLSHRYYRLKARWFGTDVLPFWDRNAPLPQDDDTRIPWRQAEEMVLAAYRGFAPEMAEIASRFFREGWIDAPARPGKASGAFAHPTVPSAHPYVLLNYLGRTRDVMTLAHELGHGVHQVLAAGQGHFLSDTPLTLAETASVFGEMLTFQALLKAERDPARRKTLLAGKVEDMLNTAVRQIALHDFEEQVHARRRDGELTPDDLSALWLETQARSLGPAIRLDDGYRMFWAYIPHFIHTPFYVYAYAFGDGLVNALYAVYRQADAGFAARYLDMLRAGGSRTHRELLAPFGLDAADPAFWRQGLDLIEGMIGELETMG
ncbi:MAG: M3 family oligoendopeptidase [Thalassobaculales bacterium]